MKKIAIFFIVIILIVAGIACMYLNYKLNYSVTKKFNLEFEKYVDKEISGTELSTIINKAVDSNEKNEVPKDNKGSYKENNQNSIKIEIKMKDDNTIYEMETFYKAGIEKFVTYYGNINFKCLDIKYHTTTNNIKYMLFEQITE